jgi:hypothetical protein
MAKGRGKKSGGASSKAKAKAVKAKTKAKTQPTAAPKASVSGATLSVEVDELVAQACSKKTYPRTTLQSAIRAIKLKLPNLSADYIKDARNSDGYTLVQAVAAEYERRAALGKYVTAEWWGPVLASFNLRCDADWGELPDVPGDDDDEDGDDEELGELVAHAIGDNPCARGPNIARLEKKLQTAQNLPLFQIKSLLDCSVESITVPRKSSMRIQLAVLLHMTQYQQHMRWPEGWAAIKSRMELVLMSHMESLTPTLDRDDFLRKFRKVIELFCPPSAVADVVTAVDANLAVPTPQLRSLLETQLGQKLFSKEARELNWAEFVNDATTRLRDLIHQDWLEGENTAFVNRMREWTREIGRSGHTAPVLAREKFVWLNFSVLFPVADLDDYWSIPHYIALASCAVNAEVVSIMPWERVLLGGGAIRNYPTVGIRQSKLTEEVWSSRKTMARHLQSMTTLAEWKTCAKTHGAAISCLNPMWRIDLYFLEHHAGNAILQRVRSLIKDTLPAVGSLDAAPEFDVKEIKARASVAISSLMSLSSTELVLCYGDGAAEDVSWVVGFLRSVQQANPPDSRLQASFPEFYKHVIALCENYVCCYEKGGTKRHPLFPTEKLVYGKMAVTTRFANLKEIAEQSARPPALSECELFRMFKWCLTVEQHELLDAWVQQNAATKRFEIEQKCLLNVPSEASSKKKAKARVLQDASVVNTLKMPAVGQASSSSSSSSSCTSSLTVGGSESQAMPDKSMIDTRRENILKLFSKKGKAV